jgi:Flp pilus assembly protein CpaB
MINGRRGRPRPGVAKAAGIVLAIVAGLMGLGYVASKVRASGGGSPVDVPVASREIEPGTVITADMISSTRIPERYRVPRTLDGPKKVIGSRALRLICKGEPFTAASVSGKGNDPLASRLPADLRAYSLTLTHGTSASDIRPGDVVDVLATGGEPPRTRTLLRSRLVLSSGSTDAEVDESGRAASRVTLQVAPLEAEALAQAECEGEVSLVVCPMTAGGPTK